jgi:uncharacterized protein YbjT (DUF2867 family)
MGQVGQIQIVRTNVTDADQVAQALRGAKAAVNLVGILYESGRQRFQGLHGEAAGTIAAIAKREGIESLIHVSAIGASAQSQSLYASSKAEGEARVREAFPAATILRPSIVFGPEDDFFNRFAALARMSPVLPLIGGGHTRFQPVYVCDVAAAALRCVERPETAGLTYELGGSNIYTFKELMQLVCAETHRRRLLMPIPFSMAMLKASVLGLLPKPMLTRDQVRLLRQDNVVAPGAHGLADLGIDPDAVEAIVPNYLWRFRREGQFENPPPQPASA